MTGTPHRSSGRGGDASPSGGGSGSHARAPLKSPVRKTVLATPSPDCSSYLRMAGSGRPDSTQGASPFPFSAASASTSRLLSFDASTSDLYARAQAMGLKLSREDLERTRAGVAAIVKRNRTSPASSVITHPHASSPPYPPTTTGGPSSRKVTTPHSGSSSVRRTMALSSGGSNSNSSAPKPTLEQVSLRKEQDGDDRRRKRQRRISETTPIQPFLQPGQLHTFTHPPYHHYHHHQHNILSSSSSQFIDFSSPISHFDPSSSAPRWKFMDRSGRPRTRPRMTLDEVGVRSEEGSDEKRKARRRRRTAEESGAELTDTDSIRHDDDDMLPLLLSLQPTHPPSSLYAGRTRNIAEDSLAELTDTDSVRPEEDEMLPLLLSHQPSELSSSALLPTAPPSAAPIQSDEYLPLVITSPSAPSVAKPEPIADEPIAEEPQPSSAADLSLSLSKSRSDMDEEGDTSINQSASAMDETMEAWDYTDGTRVVKLISDELAKGLREGTISESDIEPRYFTLPVHWGKEKAKPSHASYAGLIGLAILSSSDGKLGLAEIYQWINTTFPHYEMRDRGWQNSIRHNLSLNKSFVKVERNVLEKGKGALWSIAPGHECRFENGTYNAKKATVSKPSANGHDGTDDEADDEGEADDSKGHVGSSSGAPVNASGSRGGMSTSTADALALMKKHGGSQVLCYTMQHGTSHKYYRVKRDPVQDVAKGLAVAVAPVITISTTAGGTITPNIGGNTSLPLLVPASQESVRTESNLSSGSLLSTPARPTASQPAKRGRRPGGAPSKAAQAAVLSQAVSKAETAAARAAAKVGVVASQEPAPAPVPVAVRGRKRIPLKDKTNVGSGAKGVPGKAAIAAPAPFSSSAAKGKGKAEDPVKVTTTSFPQISMGAPFHSPSAPAGPSMMGAFTPGPAGSSNSSTRWPMRSPISSLRSSMGGALKSGSGSVMLPIAGLTPARRILGGHAGLGSQFSPLFNTPGGLGPGIGMDLGIGVGGSNNTMGFGSLRSAAMGAGTGLGSVMSPVHPLSSVLQTPARGMLSGSAMGSVGGDDSGAHGRHRRRESSGVGGGGIDGPTPLSVGGNNQWFFSSTPIRRLMSGAGSESAGRAGLSNSGPMSSPISSSIHERTGSPYARSNRSHASGGAGSGSGGGGSMIGGHPSSSIGSTSTPSAAVPGGNRSTGLTPAGDAHWLGDPFGYQGNFSHELAFTTEMGGLGTGIDSSPAKDLWRS